MQKQAGETVKIENLKTKDEMGSPKGATQAGLGGEMIVAIKANSLWTWFLNRCGFLAFAAPWGEIYVLDQYTDNRIIVAHEFVHLLQMRKDGHIRFAIKYLYYLFKYGYVKNPYEVEARSLQNIVARLLHGPRYIVGEPYGFWFIRSRRSCSREE